MISCVPVQIWLKCDIRIKWHADCIGIVHMLLPQYVLKVLKARDRVRASREFGGKNN